jgi:hypothetical protein
MHPHRTDVWGRRHFLERGDIMLSVLKILKDKSFVVFLNMARCVVFLNMTRSVSCS